MSIKNTKTRYGSIAILLHWTIAVIIISMLVIGLYMVRLPVSLEKLKFYGWHKEFGILVLMLAMLRIGWRLNNITPELPPRMPAWEKSAARGTHLVFYFSMLAMPITGWLMTAAYGTAPSFFGLFVMPALISPNENLGNLLNTIHTWLAYGLIAILCAHVGAALQHHFIHKDDILKRMLP